MKHVFALCFFTLCIISCTSNKSVSGKEVVISGKVFTEGVKEVNLEWIVDNPIRSLGQTYDVKIDSSSQFSINIPIERIATGRIRAGKYEHEICLLPGDELFIEIKDDSISYSGQGAEKNNFLFAAEKYGTGIRDYYREVNEGNLDLSGFLEAMKAFKQKRLDFFNTYPLKDELEAAFQDFYQIETAVIFEGLIQGYPERYAYRTKVPVDSLDLPDEFHALSRLSSFEDDRKVISRNYIYNLRNYIFKRGTQISKRDSLIDFGEALDALLLDSLSGKSREYAMAEWICSDLSSNRYDTLVVNQFKEIPNKDSLSIKTVDAALKKYNEKQALVGQSLHPSFRETLLADSTETRLTFGEMMEKYKGKVVYLDLWSLGCGPCIATMPRAKKMKERLKGLPIAFVYIAQDAPGDGVWEMFYEKSFTKENHYRMVNYAWGTAKMLKFMEINWVPCYMIFDTEGKLVDFNAQRPYPGSTHSPKGKSGIEIQLMKLAGVSDPVKYELQ